MARTAGPAANRSEAVYGYEAMTVVLDAIRAGGPDRARVRRAALRIRERSSPLGRYRVRGTGDRDVDAVAVYSLLDGRLRLQRELG